ncbi:hypothetical protein R6Q59_030531 [Mikania micrantha]
METRNARRITPRVAASGGLSSAPDGRKKMSGKGGKAGKLQLKFPCIACGLYFLVNEFMCLSLKHKTETEKGFGSTVIVVEVPFGMTGSSNRVALDVAGEEVVDPLRVKMLMNSSNRIAMLYVASMVDCFGLNWGDFGRDQLRSWCPE